MANPDPDASNHEERRLEAVQRYDVLDTPPDGAFDRITRLAATLLDMPIAIVTIVDHDRIWFKARHGLDVEEIGRDPGLCASAILGDEPWIVEDAARDPRALANPLAAGQFGLQFYAGAPLRTQDGYNLGTLCVIDKEPRQLGQRETQILIDLAAVVMDELELRLGARRAEAAVSERAALLDERQRQAVELHDDVVQCLVLTKMALETEDAPRVAGQIDHALESSKRILASMAQDAPSLRRDQPGWGLS